MNSTVYNRCHAFDTRKLTPLTGVTFVIDIS